MPKHQHTSRQFVSKYDTDSMDSSTMSHSTFQHSKASPSPSDLYDYQTRPADMITPFKSFGEFAGQVAKPVMLPAYRVLDAMVEVGELYVNLTQALQSMLKLQWKDVNVVTLDEDGDINGHYTQTGTKNNLLNAAENIFGQAELRKESGTISDAGMLRKLIAAVASFISETVALITRSIATVGYGIYKGGAAVMGMFGACCAKQSKGQASDISADTSATVDGQQSPLRTNPMG